MTITPSGRLRYLVDGWKVEDGLGCPM